MAVDRASRISRHYVLGDFLVDAAFPQLAGLLAPGPQIVANLRRLGAVMDRLVDQFPPRWNIVSGYRDFELNEACRKAGLPASVASLHMFGCAADIQPAEDIDIEGVFDWIGAQSRRDLGVHEAVYYPNKGLIHVAVENDESPTPKRILMRI